MVTPFISYRQEGIGNNCNKLHVNPNYWCGDIKYFNLNRPKFLHRASGAHGEVVTWVSSHLYTSVWRYATQSAGSWYSVTWVLFEISKFFCQEGPQMLCAKFRQWKLRPFGTKKSSQQKPWRSRPAWALNIAINLNLNYKRYPLKSSHSRQTDSSISDNCQIITVNNHREML